MCAAIYRLCCGHKLLCAVTLLLMCYNCGNTMWRGVMLHRMKYPRTSAVTVIARQSPSFLSRSAHQTAATSEAFELFSCVEAARSARSLSLLCCNSIRMFVQEVSRPKRTMPRVQHAIMHAARCVHQSCLPALSRPLPRVQLQLGLLWGSSAATVVLCCYCRTIRHAWHIRALLS